MPAAAGLPRSCVDDQHAATQGCDRPVSSHLNYFVGLHVHVLLFALALMISHVQSVDASGAAHSQNDLFVARVCLMQKGRYCTQRVQG
jgi:hypothetical protein